ncbi:hypothetical protein PVAP13_2NG330603 [Panicum virgatum]|uniref:Uncharacterized protein n=1 Tax=Panicum virgatum TaxID=38727 RepID=A0A8T0VHV1_PANVG|nr:hypothetical protein PVAP13_2NG330603 [Panicum virgatum]
MALLVPYSRQLRASSIPDVRRSRRSPDTRTPAGQLLCAPARTINRPAPSSIAATPSSTTFTYLLPPAPAGQTDGVPDLPHGADRTTTTRSPRAATAPPAAIRSSRPRPTHGGTRGFVLHAALIPPCPRIRSDLAETEAPPVPRGSHA